MVSAKPRKDPVFNRIFMGLSVDFTVIGTLKDFSHANLDFKYRIHYPRGGDLVTGYFILERTMKIAIATNHPGSPRKKISTP